jgi:hypothetical protein
MKKLIVLFLFIPVLCSGQTKKDIFNPKVPVVFFGADYTKVQCTKSDKFSNKPEITRYFVDANNIIERNWRHVLKNKLERDTVGWDFSFVTKANAMVDWQKVYSDNINYTVSDDEISAMIKNLNINQSKYKDCIGMFLVEENMCETKPLASMAAVFFRINDLNILLIKHYSIKPGGWMGFLSYWSLTNGYPFNKISKLKNEIK